jgi:hypothetical protein
MVKAASRLTLDLSYSLSKLSENIQEAGTRTTECDNHALLSQRHYNTLETRIIKLKRYNDDIINKIKYPRGGSLHRV